MLTRTSRAGRERESRFAKPRFVAGFLSRVFVGFQLQANSSFYDRYANPESSEYVVPSFPVSILAPAVSSVKDRISEVVSFIVLLCVNVGWLIAMCLALSPR